MALTSKDSIDNARFLSRYHALKLEVRCPGLRHSRGSIMNVCKQVYDIQGYRKKTVLAEMEMLKEQRGL